jgi:hypothetical protein
MKRWLIASAAAFLLPCFAVGSTVLFTSYMARKGKEWRDWNMELTTTQQVALSVDRWLANYWYIIGPPFVFMCFTLGIVFAIAAFRNRHV